jgi:hypothetical protein
MVCPITGADYYLGAMGSQRKAVGIEPETVECSGWNIVLNVPTGTFQNAENYRRKLLILRRSFWADQ